MNLGVHGPSRRRRWQALALLAVGGALVSFVAPQREWLHGAAGQPVVDVKVHASAQRAREVRERFDQAVLMLHAKQYEHAVTALQRVIELAPRLPEARANLGFAWLGLHDGAQAQQAFEAAIELRPGQANAYYGLAMALEQRGDLETALGAMRSYLHLSRADDGHRARARAALWEWEQKLGRQPQPVQRSRGPGPAPR
jgi:tetratricopeptide (TPR) repeat protein